VADLVINRLFALLDFEHVPPAPNEESGAGGLRGDYRLALVFLLLPLAGMHIGQYLDDQCLVIQILLLPMLVPVEITVKS